MNKKSSTNKRGNTYEYYICSTYRKKSNKLCTKHSIKVENLCKAVLQAINLHMDLLIDTDEIVNQINESDFQHIRNDNIENIIIGRKNEVSKILNFKRTLYEDWKNEDISREEYLVFKQKYENDIERINENIIRLEKEIQRNQEQIKEANEWLEKFRENRNITELTRDIMVELIDSIYVHENGNITIKFKFIDEVNYYKSEINIL